jgi:hypothetical protein
MTSYTKTLYTSLRLRYAMHTINLLGFSYSTPQGRCGSFTTLEAPGNCLSQKIKFTQWYGFNNLSEYTGQTISTNLALYKKCFIIEPGFLYSMVKNIIYYRHNYFYVFLLLNEPLIHIIESLKNILMAFAGGTRGISGIK